MKGRYVTRGIQQEIPLDIQIIVWALWQRHSNSCNGEIDWLQIFEIKGNRDEYIIRHWSEKPKYSHEHHVPRKYLSDVNDCKLFIIDDSEYVTMLFPDER